MLKNGHFFVVYVWLMRNSGNYNCCRMMFLKAQSLVPLRRLLRRLIGANLIRHLIYGVQHRRYVHVDVALRGREF